MSRIGLKPITVPAGVDISINGNEITVKGPNGTLSMDKHPNISVSLRTALSAAPDRMMIKKTEPFTALLAL